MVKCLHCGGEILEETPCHVCGMEVQYKNFRGAEMLDIKIPSSAPRQKKRCEPSEPKPEAVKKAADVKQAPPVAQRPSPGKSVFFLLVIAAIILSAIAWYYVLKFLLKF